MTTTVVPEPTATPTDPLDAHDVYAALAAPEPALPTGPPLDPATAARLNELDVVTAGAARGYIRRLRTDIPARLRATTEPFRAALAPIEAQRSQLGTATGRAVEGARALLDAQATMIRRGLQTALDAAAEAACDELTARD